MMLLDKLCFVFELIPNFKLRVSSSISIASKVWVARIFSCHERMHLIYVAAPALLALVWVPPDIGVIGTNLTTIRAATTNLIFLLIGNGEIKETTRPRGKKGIADFAVLPPDRRNIVMILILSLLSHLLLVSQLEVTDLNLALFLPAVMASQKVTWITIDIDYTQLP